jgi:hypothetical protein
MNEYNEEIMEENMEENMEETKENILFTPNRVNFIIESSTIIVELHTMMEKVKKIEAQLIQEIRSSVSTVDFFTPSKDASTRPKKRMRK